MSTKEQLQQVRESLAKLDPNNRDNLVQIASLRTQEIELSKQVAAEEADAEYQTAVQTAQTEVADIMDNLVINGLPIRSLFASESDYQLYKIEAQPAFLDQVEKYINEITTYKQQLSAAQSQVDDLHVKLQDSQQREFQLSLEVQDLTKKRDASAAETDQLKQENESLQKRIDELNAPAPVISSEEIEAKKKELTDKIKRERTIYNREWVDEIKQLRYKAKLAISGEEIEFPWTEAGKYFVIDESEVSQFREQYATEQQPVEQIPSVDPEPVQSNENVEEGQFPVITAPPIPTIDTVQGEPTDGTVVQKTLESRIAALEVAVFGKEQVA